MIIINYKDLETTAPVALLNFTKSKDAIDNIVKSYLFHYYANKDARVINALIELLYDHRAASRYIPILKKLVCHEMGVKKFVGKIDNSKLNTLLFVTDESQKWFTDYDQYIAKVNAERIKKVTEPDDKTFDGELEKFNKTLSKAIESLSGLVKTKGDEKALAQMVEVINGLDAEPVEPVKLESVKKAA